MYCVEFQLIKHYFYVHTCRNLLVFDRVEYCSIWLLYCTLTEARNHLSSVKFLNCALIFILSSDNVVFVAFAQYVSVQYSSMPWRYMVIVSISQFTPSWKKKRINYTGWFHVICRYSCISLHAKNVYNYYDCVKICGVYNRNLESFHWVWKLNASYNTIKFILNINFMVKYTWLKIKQLSFWECTVYP